MILTLIKTIENISDLKGKKNRDDEFHAPIT